MIQEIKPTYVTFEQAKWLKEKGFDEYCDQYYSQALFEGTNKDWEGIFPKFTVFKRSDFHFNSKPQNNDLWFECSAPEQWQVVEWLTLTHQINVEANYLPNIGKYRWLAVPMSIVPKSFKTRAEYMAATSRYYGKENYDTRQEAYSAAFDYIKDNNLI